MNFKQRSYQKELLDGDAIPFEDIKRNMQELNTINHLLGGHKITLRGIEHLVSNTNKQGDLHVVEIGCGGGDNLRVIKAWANKKNINIQLTGIDINKECIQFAKSTSSNNGIHFICSDYKKVSF
ncbi:MAG TPA: methyltransferase domain-containing protein, partial [Chitinophagaceae bacterium]|nr:methyltransferase domain-containing protein [Chitinophagaceae bacterium]